MNNAHASIWIAVFFARLGALFVLALGEGVR